ncbi:DUF3262 family protein [Variovorax sp. ZS18.2.2]|uniref:DUF3262 family protein n=1 Tax=Variovorax sp. ZS18.2.2 TaxID=2971255 RepID=UPI0021511D89|nr:DUF3262 family protein [Variovorax sp. ZS18.2.2]MCR6481008.1 DUF3262 family protein [Variovorax sp. ZS18.2.2]
MVHRFLVRSEWLLGWLVLVPAIAIAAIVTAAQIAAAIQNSPFANQWLRDNANAVANLAINVESRGDTAAFNGSCCYGVLQMNTSNIAAFTNLTPEQYRRASLQDQVNAWSELTVQALQAKAPRTLAGMSSFDGRPVDDHLVLACVQLGIGNCQRMLNAGRCAAFADSNGTTICSMADRINGTGASTGSGTGSGGSTGGTGSTGGGSQPVEISATCIRDASGACVPISEALRNGFLRGSGVKMETLRFAIQGLTFAITLLIIGWMSLGLWQEYAAGRIVKAELLIASKGLGVIAIAVLIAMSLT